MRTRYRLPAAILFAITICVFVGCGPLIPGDTTPAVFDPSRPMQDRVASAERIYTATLKELTTLRREGLIDDETQLSIAKLRQKASLALDSAHLYADAGDISSADAQLTIIQGVINELAKSLADARQKKG